MINRRGMLKWLSVASAPALGVQSASAVQSDAGSSQLGGWLRAATGAVARTVGSIFTERIPTPLDFIPFSEHAAIYAGRSTYNASTAIAAALAVGRGIKMPGKLYRVSSPITASADVRGEGAHTTQIRPVAGAARFECLIELTGQNTNVTGLKLTGDELVNDCVRYNGSNGGRVAHCDIGGALFDGVHFAVNVNNSEALVENNVFSRSGHIPVIAGTVSNADGSTSATFAGAPDLTTFGFRPYMDKLRIGTKTYTIMSATATTLTLSAGIEGANRNAAFSVLRGYNVMIANNGDNSSIGVNHNTFLQGKAGHTRDNSLFGAKFHNNVHEGTTGDCITVGVANGAGAFVATRGHTNTGIYLESPECSYILVEAALDPLFQISQGEEPLAALRVPNWDLVTNLTISKGSKRHEGNVLYLGNYASATLPWGYEFHIFQTTRNNTITLPALTAAELANASRMAGGVRIKMLSMGGFSLTVKSDALPVNSAPDVATGVTLTGDYRDVFAQPTQAGKWAATATAAL